ncbi:DUF1127 domain-containing protein [Roseibium suaedae]|uniref:YjiS-like domain-containing protein n=1 Tax=Roseibium suaedae TaxID=735517 RepID=A0A1M6ZMP5_9HYPH|nr:DUF1127 domain-containing protein [Roseibium suaedae]SHL31808.1 protein of unknown function [Roseibium suaedae]
MTLIHERSTNTINGFSRLTFQAAGWVFRSVSLYLRRRATMRSLGRLGDRDLQDIGVRRTSVGYELIDGGRRNPRRQ